MGGGQGKSSDHGRRAGEKIWPWEEGREEVLIMGGGAGKNFWPSMGGGAGEKFWSWEGGRGKVLTMGGGAGEKFWSSRRDQNMYYKLFKKNYSRRLSGVLGFESQLWEGGNGAMVKLSQKYTGTKTFPMHTPRNDSKTYQSFPAPRTSLTDIPPLEILSVTGKNKNKNKINMMIKNPRTIL